jgi:hypothetical protein
MLNTINYISVSFLTSFEVDRQKKLHTVLMLSIIKNTEKILQPDVDQVINITFLTSFEVDHQKVMKF